MESSESSVDACERKEGPVPTGTTPALRQPPLQNQPGAYGETGRRCETPLEDGARHVVETPRREGE